VGPQLKALDLPGVCVFDLGGMRVLGPEGPFSRRVREQLRRYGIRFY